jgi:polysaccharide biosynthesis protein PslE
MIIQISKWGLANVVFRHQRILLAIALGSICVGAIYCVVTPRIFRSDAAVFVRFADTAPKDNPGSAAIPASQAERREVINTFVKIVGSQDLLVDMLREVGPANLYPSVDAKPDDPAIFTGALARLKGDLKAEPDRDSYVIELSLNNPNSEVAASALGTFIRLFIDRQNNLTSASQSTFMQEQVRQAQERLVQSQKQLDQFVAAFGISSLDDERTALLRVEMETRSTLAQQRSRVAEAESRFTTLSAAFANLKPMIELSDENDRYKGVDDARTRLADLNARRAELHNYRLDSLTMQTLDAQFAEAKRELDIRTQESAARVRTGPNPVYQQTQADLVRADEERQGDRAAVLPLQQQLEQITARLAELSSKEAEYHTLLLQRDTNEESYRSFLQKADDARVADALRNQNVTGIALLQKPTLPLLPAQPRVKLIMVAALGIGLAGGLLACFALEKMDETFSSPEQIEPVLGLPVVGAFPDARPSRYAAQ